MADYIGVIEFEKPLYCRKEVSGKHFRSRILETEVLLIFPSIPDNFTPEAHDMANGNLVVPGDLFKGQVSWGLVHAWPEGIFSVNRVLCYFSAIEQEVDSIYSSFRRWKEKMRNLQLIDTGNYVQPQQKPSAILQGGGFYDGLQIFQICDGNTLKNVVNVRTEPIEIHFPKNDEAYSVDRAEKLFSDAGNPKEIAIAYELLITAYQAMERHDFRSAVILGGSALEKAILNRIKLEYARSTTYETEKEKHRMLGGKFRWLTELHIDIPVSDYQNTILDIRNSATHEGIRPPLVDTKTCLENCKKLIEVYQPEVLEQ